MNPIDVIRVRLRLDGPCRPSPAHLRGAVAALFPDDPLFHQHAEDGLVYRIPRIQYRWDDRGPVLVGIEDGAARLVGVGWPGLELRLGNDRVRVADAEVSFRRSEVRFSPHLLRYRLQAPWLPFSQENYARYRMMSPPEQAYERDRLARAGILISLRGLGVEVDERLFVAVEDVRPTFVRYKGVEMLGFLGRLLVNLELPAGFAFGRSVSHGNGWILPEGAGDDA